MKTCNSWVVEFIRSKLYETLNAPNTAKQDEAALIGLESENQQLKEAVLRLDTSYAEEKKSLQLRVKNHLNT